MKLSGCVALVTGGGKRVGQAIALALARHQAHVVISYQRSKSAADETVRRVREIGVQAQALRANLSSADDVKRMMEQIRERFGRLDVLVNNAAIFERTPFDKLTEREWDQHLDINLKGPFLCALYAAPLLKKAPRARIINIADWAGERPYNDYLPYCISKAGVIALTKALAKELAPTVGVVGIAPGPILPPPDMTPAEKQRVIKRVPLGHWGSPEDIANTVVFAIEGTDFMTGSTIFVDGGRLIA